MIRFHKLSQDRGKLFLVNSRAIMGPPTMSLLFDAERMAAFIIKPRQLLVVHTDDLGWFITSNQQRQMHVQQNLDRFVSRPNGTPG